MWGFGLKRNKAVKRTVQRSAKQSSIKRERCFRNVLEDSSVAEIVDNLTSVQPHGKRRYPRIRTESLFVEREIAQLRAALRASILAKVSAPHGMMWLDGLRARRGGRAPGRLFPRLRSGSSKGLSDEDCHERSAKKCLICVNKSSW